MVHFDFQVGNLDSEVGGRSPWESWWPQRNVQVLSTQPGTASVSAETTASHQRYGHEPVITASSGR